MRADRDSVGRIGAAKQIALGLFAERSVGREGATASSRSGKSLTNTASQPRLAIRYHCIAVEMFARERCRQIKTLRGLTPYEYLARIWTENPGRFKIDPRHHMPGPNT